MCGIWALFGYRTDSVAHWEKTFFRLKHRGPDGWRLHYDRRIKNCVIGFARLTIVDSVYGMQPMILHQFPHLTLICNGELYNCKRLGEELGFEYETQCDVECIIRLYASAEADIRRTVERLDGVFGFVLVDSERMKVFAARDPYGVRPLFRLTRSDVVGFTSEAKGLVALQETGELSHFPPGHYAEYDILQDGNLKLVTEEKFYSIGERPKFKTLVPYQELSCGDVHGDIRKLLSSAVEKRLMSDRRIGCLLSGGLDSSLIAGLLVKHAQKHQLPYQIQSFAIGMGNSPDLVAARQVAEHLGTDHHEVSFTPESVAKVIDNVIYHLETCDITTVRASIGMFIVAEYIVHEKGDTTVVMSGEGADELCQGYIYFRDAPDEQRAHSESMRLLEDIYLYDGLRADRTTAAHSLELRVPFLDLQFTEYYLNLPAEMRRPQGGVEKHLLRSAFADTGLLPHNILWRHKEAFSDGVASMEKSLFKVIQEIVEPRISDEMLKTAPDLYPHLTPKTKEAMYYRQVFEKHYPHQTGSQTPYYWMPKWTDVTDPSARFISHYKA